MKKLDDEKEYKSFEEQLKEFENSPAYYVLVIILSILTSVITTIVATR